MFFKKMLKLNALTPANRKCMVLHILTKLGSGRAKGVSDLNTNALQQWCHYSISSKKFHIATQSSQWNKCEEDMLRDINESSFAKDSAMVNFDDENIAKIISNRVSNGSQDAFYVVDLRAILKRHAIWASKLPNVKPFYAIQCNPDQTILQLLKQLGCGFACGSKEEIGQALSTGVSVRNIIYANPCKQLSHLEYAKQHSIEMMIFDSCDELTKIKQVCPSSKLVLRLLVGDAHSRSWLGSKYGAPIEQVPELLSYAKRLNLAVTGVSFHIGTGQNTSSAHAKAVIDARKVWDMAKNVGYDLSMLDVGGGFQIEDTETAVFENAAEQLTSSLRENFPENSGFQIIAEPGSFFVKSSHILALNIIARKTLAASSSSSATGPHYMYYVNDGIYGSFRRVLHGAMDTSPKLLQRSHATEIYSCSVWGETRSELDCITKNARLPQLNVGDWIYYDNMGAYAANATGSLFSGFQPPEKIYCHQDEYGI